jgi:hypothetical protein
VSFGRGRPLPFFKGGGKITIAVVFEKRPNLGTFEQVAGMVMLGSLSPRERGRVRENL